MRVLCFQRRVLTDNTSKMTMTSFTNAGISPGPSSMCAIS